MNIKTIFPYLKRLQRLNPTLTACVYEHKEKLAKELKASGLIAEFVDKPTNAHLVVFGYNNVEGELPDFWDAMKIEGWVVFNDTEHNFELVQKWRKEHKVTSLLSRINGLIYFQKEDYSERGRTKSDGEIILEKMQFENEVIEKVPDYKSSHLKDEYIQRYGNGDVFVETGTYLGQTVEMVRRSTLDFKKIYSIEIDDRLFKAAKKYFGFDSRIRILKGDSVDKIARLCKALKNRPATFWLDAHASGPLPGGKYGPCPLREELTAIKATGRTDHTIFVDDRRLFGSAEWGGVTEAEIMDLIKAINPDYQLTYLDGEIPGDVLCAHVVSRDYVAPPEVEPLPENIKKLFGVDKPKPEVANKPKLIFMD